MSQRIGLLLCLARKGNLSKGGQDRLFYLQSKAPFEAIEAGLKFCQRLLNEEKLQSDFKHQIIELNRKPQSRRFRRYSTSRIGVGYRDKGTLPKESDLAVLRANEEGIINLDDLRPEVRKEIEILFPDLIEGEWLDLNDLSLEILSDERNLLSLVRLLTLL